VKYTLAIVLFAASCVPVLAQQAPADGGKWRESEQSNEMDQNKSTTLMLDAEQQTVGAAGPTTPTLVFRCVGKKANNLELYFSVGVVETDHTTYEGGGEVRSWARIRTRFDEGKPQPWLLTLSTDYAAIFSDNPRYFVKRMLVGQAHFLEFTPFQKMPVTVMFDVRGLEAHLGSLSTCMK
jgi:hypothetical protein